MNLAGIEVLETIAKTRQLTVIEALEMTTKKTSSPSDGSSLQVHFAGVEPLETPAKTRLLTVIEALEMTTKKN